MELRLVRKTFTDRSTIGELYVNGEKQCYTLEDKDRDINMDGDHNDAGEGKVYGKTAIPYGRYEVVITYSNNFKQYMPLLLKVSGYEGVRIHSGNSDANTLGCILVGNGFSNDWISDSRTAYKALFAKIKAVEKKEKVFIEIVKG